jgi:hypothetical protein
LGRKTDETVFWSPYDAAPARRPRGTDARKDDHNLKSNIWPGLALAGGVVIAALVALLLIGGDGGSSGRMLPSAGGPGATRLFPGPVAAPGTAPDAAPPDEKPREAPAREGPAPGSGALAASPGSSAAMSQYGASGNRGTVLASP